MFTPTPGPWEIVYTHDGTIENSSKSAAIYFRDKSTKEGMGSIRICGLNTGNPLAGENESNARLIAAAPEMYEELKRINDGLPNVISDLTIDKSLPLARLCDRLTVLLSKIEGR